jgi:hypothetical protein
VLGWKGALQGKEQGVEELIQACSPSLDFLYITDKSPINQKWSLTLRMSLTIYPDRLNLLGNSVALALSLVEKISS